MSKEKELIILLEFIKYHDLPQSYFQNRRKYGSDATISRTLNKFGDNKVLRRKKRFKKSTHVDINYWLLEETADSYIYILKEFLGSKDRFKKEFLDHQYFWNKLEEFYNEIDLPLFWKIAKALSREELGLKFALSDLNKKAFKEWIPILIRYFAMCDPYRLILSDEEITALKRLCLFPGVLKNLISIFEEKGWLEKPIAFFQKDRKLPVETGKVERMHRFLLFAHPFVSNAFQDLLLLLDQCRDNCRELIDLAHFDYLKVLPYVDFEDYLLLGGKESQWSAIQKLENVFCPNVENL